MNQENSREKLLQIISSCELMVDDIYSGAEVGNELLADIEEASNILHKVEEKIYIQFRPSHLQSELQL
jgi:hypothetical protein|tara:strand:+ start:236 stop:439 length:204 start_codon:yes stop_codon:yes gene_type:complete